MKEIIFVHVKSVEDIDEIREFVARTDTMTGIFKLINFVQALIDEYDTILETNFYIGQHAKDLNGPGKEGVLFPASIPPILMDYIARGDFKKDERNLKDVLSEKSIDQMLRDELDNINLDLEE